MKYTHEEYLFTRDHRTPEQVRAAKREAIIGWLVLASFTCAVFILAKMFLT